MSIIVKPNTFTVGATIIASEHNSNFDTIYNDYNGNISNNNIAPSAGIVDTKLAQITTANKVSIEAVSTMSGIIVMWSGAISLSLLDGLSVTGITVLLTLLTDLLSMPTLIAEVRMMWETLAVLIQRLSPKLIYLT